jgi:aspartate/methionine/tyrosine aminotransferase
LDARTISSEASIPTPTKKNSIIGNASEKKRETLIRKLADIALKLLKEKEDQGDESLREQVCQFLERRGRQLEVLEVSVYRFRDSIRSYLFF